MGRSVTGHGAVTISEFTASAANNRHVSNRHVPNLLGSATTLVSASKITDMLGFCGTI